MLSVSPVKFSVSNKKMTVQKRVAPSFSGKVENLIKGFDSIAEHSKNGVNDFIRQVQKYTKNLKLILGGEGQNINLTMIDGKTGKSKVSDFFLNPGMNQESTSYNLIKTFDDNCRNNINSILFYYPYGISR